MPDIKFSCSALRTLNGYTLHAAKPDADGAYDVVIGALGVPTRNNVIYETQSFIQSMNDPTSRFNICLKDGNLAGEYGHPPIKSSNELDRLMQIDEKNISHYFTKIWVGDPISVDGHHGRLLQAKVIPTGPYGEVLRKQLEDPNHNTAFSIRSICRQTSGPNPNIEYRKVDLVVTFDAVFAPGFSVASKRYVRGTESFEINVTRDDVYAAADRVSKDTQAVSMIDPASAIRIFNSADLYHCGGNEYRTSRFGRNEVVDKYGNSRPAASLIYRS